MPAYTVVLPRLCVGWVNCANTAQPVWGLWQLFFPNWLTLPSRKFLQVCFENVHPRYLQQAFSNLIKEFAFQKTAISYWPCENSCTFFWSPKSLHWAELVSGNVANSSASQWPCIPGSSALQSSTHFHTVHMQNIPLKAGIYHISHTSYIRACIKFATCFLPCSKPSPSFSL